MQKLTEALLQANLITREQLQDAKDKQIGEKKPLQELLVDMGFIDEEALMKVSSEIFNRPVTSLDDEEIDLSVRDLLSYEKARRYGVFPLRKENGALVLAMSNLQDIVALDDVKIETGMDVVPVLCRKSEISRYIGRYYQSNDAVYDLLKNIATDEEVEILKEQDAGYGSSDAGAVQGDDSPIVRMVNLILADAVKERASDIHIEPQERYVAVRYRIDGALKDILKVPNELKTNLIGRIKILSDLDITENRKPQDGRAAILVNKRKIDLRISTIPIFYGEKVVMRILDTNEARVELDRIGMDKKDMEWFRRSIRKPQGMILVTGPTGSGKTSTLYAGINYIKSESKNIMTIEDPIEYLMDGINQIQVNPVKNLTFATGLRSILRQDPNVILVGEIRDEETANIAFRASLTGHLVFSTLHTNNAVASITRLIDIGLEPYLISSSLLLIIAQRLVRCICPFCKTEYTPDEKVLSEFKPYLEKYQVTRFYKGAGCDKCGFIGFIGRTAIFEMIPFDESIRALVLNGSSEDEIFREALNKGARSLSESGVGKVAAGITTLEEVAGMTSVFSSDVASPAAPANGPVLSVPDSTPRENGKPRILIVDDEEIIRKVLAKRLVDAGYEVVSAEDGRQAVESAAREDFDLIIMDVMMPNMDGFEAVKILRSKLRTASVPIMMLTARKDKESELKGIDLGADDYLTKPFDKDKLLTRIKMLLRRNVKTRHLIGVSV